MLLQSLRKNLAITFCNSKDIVPQLAIIAFLIQAEEAMGTLNVALGEWEKANNH